VSWSDAAFGVNSVFANTNWWCACFRCKRVLFTVEEWKLCTASATLSQRTTSTWWVDGVINCGVRKYKGCLPGSAASQIIDRSHATSHNLHCWSVSDSQHGARWDCECFRLVFPYASWKPACRKQQHHNHWSLPAPASLPTWPPSLAATHPGSPHNHHHILAAPTTTTSLPPPPPCPPKPNFAPPPLLPPPTRNALCPSPWGPCSKKFPNAPRGGA